MTTTAVRRMGRMSTAMALTVTLAACGGLGGGAVEGSGLSDRFASLFSNRGQPVGTTPAAQQQASQPDCPGVDIRAGASTLAVGARGKPENSTDVRYQLTIAQTARECSLSSGMVTAKVGVQGRVVVGPRGAPATVTVPMRIAVVQEGITPKTIFSKLYQTTVDVGGETNVPFTLVAEDIAYPVTDAGAMQSYVFYVGFDAAPERPARAGRRR